METTMMETCPHYHLRRRIKKTGGTTIGKTYRTKMMETCTHYHWRGRMTTTGQTTIGKTYQAAETHMQTEKLMAAETHLQPEEPMEFADFPENFEEDELRTSTICSKDDDVVVERFDESENKL
jgi:hypothetical protein